MISTCCSAVVSTSPRLPLDVEWCGLCESMVKAYNVEGDAPRAVGRESVARSRPFFALADASVFVGGYQRHWVAVCEAWGSGSVV